MSRVGDGSSFFDYLPISGPIRAFSGDGGDDDAGPMAGNQAQTSMLAGERRTFDGYEYWMDEAGQMHVEGAFGAGDEGVEGMLQEHCPEYAGGNFQIHRTGEDNG